MNDNFEKRLWAAALAGWWTLLVAAGVLMLQWIVYLLVMSGRPMWFLSLWGPDVSWHDVHNIWFLGLGFFKVCLLLLAVVVLWLTLWARRLRKGAGSS
ncbi:MAG: hypothetical protein ABSA71_00730 [Desulfomonilia bacterium]|jgi:hypothetical protein